MKALVQLLLRRPGFRWLWLGETVSLVGDWLSYVAVSVLALEAGEGAAALALVFAAHILPNALVAPVAGIVADRFDKKRLLIGTQLVMAALMVGMVAAAWSRSLWLVQLLLFVRTSVAGFFYPAKSAALRELVHEDELVDANSIDAATWSVTFTAGTALGGVAAMLGPVIALAIDGATFLVAALLLARLPALSSPASTRTPVGFEEVRSALAQARRVDGLLEAVLTKAPLAVAGGGAWVLLNLTAERIGLFGSAALALGALQSLRGIGTGVGPVLSRRLLSRGFSVERLMRLSALVTLVSVGAFTLVATLELGWLPIALTAVAWGVGGGGLWVFSTSSMQAKSPAGVLGRLSSVDMLTFTLGQGAAALAAGYAVDATAFPAIAGIFGLLLGGALYALLRMVLAPRTVAALSAA